MRGGEALAAAVWGTLLTEAVVVAGSATLGIPFELLELLELAWSYYIPRLDEHTT